MVSDPRVTPLLHRLGGLYRDPTRIDRDASSLLKSSVGIHLQPGIAALVENNGQTAKCLTLQGTIGIVFRGVTYQLLIDMFLPPGYPMRPPVCYVRLANPNMYLKENHPHVGRDGMVYLPYLSEWNQHSHNLVELVVAMSSVFSADPPVFTRSAAAAAAPAPAAAAAQPVVVAAKPLPTTAQRVQQVPTMLTSLTQRYANAMSSSNSNTATATTSTSTKPYDESPGRIQAQAEEILAKEAEEANRAAEIARAIELQEQEQERARLLQIQFEQQQLVKTKAKVSQKVRDQLQQQMTLTRKTIQQSWKDRHVLPQNQTVLKEQLQQLEHQKAELEQYIASVATQTQELQVWLDETKENHESISRGGSSSAAKAAAVNIPVDDLVMGSNKLQDQILRLEAENAAISDLLYCLDRRMFHQGSESGGGSGGGSSSSSTGLDAATFLKQVRQLAKRQFLVRAHLLKIRSAITSCASF